MSAAGGLAQVWFWHRPALQTGFHNLTPITAARGWFALNPVFRIRDWWRAPPANERYGGIDRDHPGPR